MIDRDRFPLSLSLMPIPVVLPGLRRARATRVDRIRTQIRGSNGRDERRAERAIARLPAMARLRLSTARAIPLCFRVQSALFGTFFIDPL